MGHDIDKASRSSEQLSVLIISGPIFFPWLKKALAGSISLYISSTLTNVSVFSSLVIIKPSCSAPITLCVQIRKTHKLCSSTFELESMKTSSQECLS